MSNAGARVEKYARFEPLERSICRLVLGTGFRDFVAESRVEELLDAYVRLGGNCLDTALVYHDSESVIGSWMRNRGNRDDLVLHAKGVHHQGEEKRVTPRAIQHDLEQTCELLGVQAVDVFTLHRDAPEQELAPLLECLDRLRREGWMHCYGASNWTVERLEEADVCAAEKGLTRFAVSSPQYSLAVPREPIWPGSLDARDPSARDWYERTQRPLFAWSPLALGFFGPSDERPSSSRRGVIGKAHPRDDVERVFGGTENRLRRERAGELARGRGVSATQVALAWVLHQPLALHAVVGPRSVEELEQLFAAFEIALTPTELAWLDLRTDDG